MPYEKFQYVFVKQDIPNLTVKNTQCPFCSQNIDLENNCVICENGHRLHHNCWQNQSVELKCPVCKGLVEKICYGFNGNLGRFAYSYLPKTGGNYKKHKTLKRKHRKFTNKSKKHKRTRYHRKK
jgi:hypothetical protein